MYNVAGKRVLVIEDEGLIAIHLAGALEECDVVVIGPVGTVTQALTLIGDEAIDCALLDVNLAGESSLAVAEALKRRHIPFAFCTGYHEDLGFAAFAEAPVLGKPYSMEQVCKLIEKLCDAA